jgi:IclR family acetate operon transcriptional repressor
LTSYFLIHKIHFMDIKTAARTLDLFEAFAGAAKPMRLSELAEALHAPVSSCYQLLRTLENRGYVYGLRLKNYYPTKRMLRNAEKISLHDPVLNLVGPAMEVLRDRTGESVLIAQLQGEQALVLDVFESAQSIRYSSEPGSLRQLHCSAIGKCLLGEMSAEERDRCLPAPPYPRLTANTFTTRKALHAELDRSRERGWYESLGETVPELSAVAAPVRLAGGLFALSVAGPTSRFAAARAKHAKALMVTAEQMRSIMAAGA